MKTYRCDVCGCTNVKLWRDYESAPRLLCFKHTMEKEHSAGDDGQSHSPNDDSIHWSVAAVPTNFAECMTEPIQALWGYTSVPPDAAAWWQALA